MTRTTTTGRRRGFSLLELMTVIFIITLLATITIGVVGSVRKDSSGRATEEALVKLHDALDRQRAAVVDKCQKDRSKRTPDFVALTAFCGGDEDRAEGVWVYMNLRREFPQTVVEATTAFTIPGSGVVVPPRATFRSAAGAAAGSAFEQAAVLLYLSLSEKASANDGVQADLMAQSDLVIGGNTFKVFRDSWGTPIVFARHAQNPEVRGGDPFDPRGRLAGAWPVAANKLAASTALGVNFDGQNKILTAISAGPNKTFDGGATIALVVGSALATDDVFSYRVKKQGQRAD